MARVAGGSGGTVAIVVRTAGDATRHELAVLAPLVLATATLGLQPWLLLDLTAPAVRALLGPAGAP